MKRPFHTYMKAICALLVYIGLLPLHAAEESPIPPLDSAVKTLLNQSLVNRLQKLWRDDLSKREAFKFHKKLLSQQLFERERIVVREITGMEAFKRIDGTLMAKERSLVLTGDLEVLRKQTKLTEIHNPGTFGSGFSAYLDSNGALILLWVIPEG